MSEKKIQLNLKSPLSFWEHFSGRERFFWYDSQKSQLIIGAERLEKTEQRLEVPYLFYTKTFFDEVQGELWQDFGEEVVAFKHYFVKNSEESFYWSAEQHEQISDQTFSKVKHQIKEKPSDFEAWTTLFQAIQEKMAQGKAQKIVASREIEFDSQTTFNLESILEKLIENNPGAFIFAYQKGTKVFLGASPEILAQKKDEKILSYALAGTLPKTVEKAGEKLLKDPKNLHEHEIVVKKIKEKLREKSAQVNVGSTELMALKNVYHLRTILTAYGSGLSLIDWANHLHPTPALGGAPNQVALDFLRSHEKHERGLYAAPLGIIDPQGNGTIIVGIRSALIDGKKLFAYAGCGIVPSSDCLEEFNETKIKLKTILEAL